MPKMNRITVNINDYNDEWMTLVDLWDPKGKIEITENSLFLNEIQLCFGRKIGRIEIS